MENIQPLDIKCLQEIRSLVVKYKNNYFEVPCKYLYHKLTNVTATKSAF